MNTADGTATSEKSTRFESGQMRFLKHRQAVARLMALLIFAVVASGLHLVGAAVTVTREVPAIEPQQEIQDQIQRTLDAFEKETERGCHELKELKVLANDDAKLVKQLAYFAEHLVKGEPGIEVLKVRYLLDHLDIRASVIIATLAPYLDAEDEELRSLVQDWFQFHDKARAPGPGLPPLQPVNYSDYEKYVQDRLTLNQPLPEAFVKYIFDALPGNALLAIAFANYEAHADHEGQEPTPRDTQTSDIIWAEHIISDAIWRRINGFDERFEEINQEAVAELEKLSKHDAWWVRLYVAEIVKQHPELGAEGVVERLRQDKYELVRETLAQDKEKTQLNHETKKQ